MEPLYLTAGQCRYLGGLVDATHADAPWEPTDTVIFDRTDDGWIMVVDADSLEGEGSGVWVDTNGVEHHGPAWND